MAPQTPDPDHDTGPPTLQLPEAAKSESAEALADKAFNVVATYLDAAGGRVNSKVHLLPAHWRMVYVLHYVDGEVNNGGFHQFFTNSQGVFDQHLQDDVEMLAHQEYSDLFQVLLGKYAQIDYTDQWKNIGGSWEVFSKPYSEGRFEEEGTAYSEISPSFLDVIGEYIRKNFAEFSTDSKANPLGLQAPSPPAPLEHPFWRRFNWNPFVVIFPFTYMWYTAFARDLPLPRTLGASFMSLWLVMAAIDFWTGHKLLDWMYGPDDEDE